MAHHPDDRPEGISEPAFIVHNLLHVLGEAGQVAKYHDQVELIAALVVATNGEDVMLRGVPLSPTELKVMKVVIGFVEAVRLLMPEMAEDMERMRAVREGLDLSEEGLSGMIGEVEDFLRGE